MPDWRELVRQRVESKQLSPENHEEIVSELASHLEETYEEACSRGLAEAGAIEFSLLKVTDWHVLTADICRAKGVEHSMNTRTKSFWLPAMASLTGAAVLLMILQKFGVQPRIVWAKDSAMRDVAMVIYLPWLFALPLIGALGAYLARRSQARSLARLASALAPSLAMLGTFCFGLLVGLVIDRRQFVSFPVRLFLLYVLDWVALPGLALSLGALPFLKESSELCELQQENQPV